MLQRYLDPNVLASISNLDLVAKTVVDGFIAGLHRSPDFGFSQEFAEYRAYVEGDDLRHVDWNVFARTERCFLKRYRGETNSQVTLVLDASASMGYSSSSVTKLDYARYLAASLFYMSARQKDAAGVAIFAEDVANYIPPSTRQGQLARLLHAINEAKLGVRTDYSKPFRHLQEFLKRRGIVVVISDFFADPDAIIKTMQPLRYKCSEIVLFHLLDPSEIRPDLRQPTLFIDMETKEEIEVTPEYSRTEYRQKIDGHIEALRSKARASGMDYQLVDTAKPLDASLREYLAIRKGRF